MAYAIERNDDDVMVVLPADQAIRDEDGFRAALAAAGERAGGGDMVTLGVEPTEPATGYGYVIASGESTPYSGRDSYRVHRFEEKPSPERAQALIASGSAYWNAGIFVWMRSCVVGGLERHAPDITIPIRDWIATAHRSMGPGWPGSAMAQVYGQLRATSIDYALLEPASLEGEVGVVPADIGWSDLGSWSALRDHRAVDSAAVISEEPGSRVIDIDGRDVLVYASGGRTVAVVGLEDVVVIDTPDALLVSSSDAAQDVRKVVDLLRAEGRDDLL
jgi:mannose-1-phosphate guanylyltransferase